MGHKVGHCPTASLPSEKERWCFNIRRRKETMGQSEEVSDSLSHRFPFALDFFFLLLLLSWFYSLFSVSQPAGDWLQAHPSLHCVHAFDFLPPRRSAALLHRSCWAVASADTRRTRVLKVQIKAALRRFFVFFFHALLRETFLR